MSMVRFSSGKVIGLLLYLMVAGVHAVLGDHLRAVIYSSVALVFTVVAWVQGKHEERERSVAKKPGPNRAA